MPLILIVEQESRDSERMRQILTAEGWQVQVVEGPEQALQAARAQAPQLVLINSETVTAGDLFQSFSRHRGGPGTIALIPSERGASELAADQTLTKPFSDQDLREAVRRCLASEAQPASEVMATADSKLSTADIFGEVLTEVDERRTSEPSSPASAPSPSASAEEPVPTRTARDRKRDRETEEEVNRQLDETLSGILQEESSRSRAEREERKRREDEQSDVDDLLEQTFPELDWESLRRPRRSRPATAVAGEFGAVAAPSQEGQPARSFGQYRLLERIAAGGMAEVWKARMTGLEGFQKTVAIKKILPQLTDSVDFVSMFIDEAKLAAQLSHPNIIHIYDLGKIDAEYFIAMEYVEGKNLRVILDRAQRQGRAMPLELALLVTTHLAGALDYAHRKRDSEGRELALVHRDVSPQNVLISYDGHIKLCDFGIAKAVSKIGDTQVGALKGKLQYMSPEQASGKPVDARSDLFSLGAVAFEMVTGRRLFIGDTEMAILDAVRECRVTPPAELVPELPEQISALLLKALAARPEERFQNAAEMQEAVDEALYSRGRTPSRAELGAYVHELFPGEGGDLAQLSKRAEQPSVETTWEVEETPAEPEALAVEESRLEPELLGSAPAVSQSRRPGRLLLRVLVLLGILLLALWLWLRWRAQSGEQGLGGERGGRAHQLVSGQQPQYPPGTRSLDRPARAVAQLPVGGYIALPPGHSPALSARRAGGTSFLP